MDRYKYALTEYHQSLSQFHSLVTRLTMNIKKDKEGLFKDHTQFSNRLYELSSSIQYRLISVDWHLRNICREHSFMEHNLLKNGLVNNQEHRKDYGYYLFDDFIFNLISLYDYFGSYLYLSFIDNNEHKKMWSSLAKAAGSVHNPFSYCTLGKEVFEHNRKWASKLINFRAEVIHYKHRTGGEKRRMTVSNIKNGIGQARCQLMYSIPEDLVKHLNLESCVKNELGVDLQFGSIEIGKKAFIAFEKLSKIALTKCTKNSIEFQQSSSQTLSY